MGKSKKQQEKGAKFVAFCKDKKLLTKFETEVLEISKKVGDKKAELEDLEFQLKSINSIIDKKEQTLKGERETLMELNEQTVNSSKKIKLTKANENTEFRISKLTSTKRRSKPTEFTSAKSLLDVRRGEMWKVASCIHGATEENKNPVLFGLYDTVCAKFCAEKFGKVILQGKASVANSIKKKIREDDYKSAIHSDENISRSLSIYYSHSVMGKQKYISLRKANRNANTKMNKHVTYVPYQLLSTTINNIDIGVLNDIHPSLTYGLSPEEIGEGNYRDCKEYIPRMAKFYLIVDSHRKDKLRWFPDIARKDIQSKLFCIAFGGDGAPLSGMSMLISFINVTRRINSSAENFLIFGANVDECGTVAKRFVTKFMDDIKYLESKVFELNIGDVMHKVGFKLTELPNDMKYLAVLGGELSNSAYYFSTFGDVNQNNSNMVYTYGHGAGNKWKPWKYEDRVKAVKHVADKREQLEKENNNKETERTKLTNFIGQKQKCRQEFIPLVGSYIDVAKSEPLHLKNNVWIRSWS